MKVAHGDIKSSILPGCFALKLVAMESEKIPSQKSRKLQVVEVGGCQQVEEPCTRARCELEWTDWMMGWILEWDFDNVCHAAPVFFIATLSAAPPNQLQL